MAQSKRCRILILGFLLMLFIPMAVDAQITVRFEGVVNLDPIGTLNGVVFGPDWLGLIDLDAGGTGNMANEPSPSSCAILTNSPSPNDSDRRITFPQPVKTVSFFYTLDTDQGTPIVSFYSSDGTLVGNATMDVCGRTSCGSGCAGDPSGSFCAWAELVFTSAGSYISYMEFTDTAAAYYIIDNLTLQNPLNRNGFWAPPGQIGGALAIDIRGNNLAVGWGAYDKETGEPSWLYSQNVMTDADHYSGPLWRYGQGQCFDCPYIAGPGVQQEIDTITITFHDETSATISALGITKFIEKVD